MLRQRTPQSHRPRPVRVPAWASLFTVLLVGAALSSSASAQVETSTSMDDGVVSLGLGLGDPSAVDAKFWFTENGGLNIGLGLENLDDLFVVYGEYEFGIVDFEAGRAHGVFYVGVGGAVAFLDGVDDLGLAAIVPIGLDFRFRRPVDVYLEGRPGIEVIEDAADFAIGAQAGVRYVF